MRFSVFLDYIYVIVFYLEFQVIVYTQYIHHLLYGNQFKLSGELIVHKIFFIIVYSDPISKGSWVTLAFLGKVSEKVREW